MSTSIKGGEFLIRDTAAEDIFIPEEWDEEQLMIFSRQKYILTCNASTTRKKD
jgi:hypothetical protein